MNLRSSAQVTSSFKLKFAFVIMSIPNSTSDIEILSGEKYSYVFVDPGVFKNIEWFSYGKVLVLELEDEGIENVKVS